jgi:hypothetical protein
VIHYHGTPITPREQLLRMVGRNFCISMAAPADLKTCLQIGQSLMFDSGAFSAFTRGHQVDWNDYYKWLEPNLAHPHWAVVPDVIGGGVEEQRELQKKWPRDWGLLGAPVWHLNLPTDWLLELAGHWSRICIGSSGQYWDVGGEKWCRRMDQAFNALEKMSVKPWVHGLRMLGQLDGGWPLASADSTNVAQNHNRHGCANCMAEVIDAQQPVLKWKTRAEQENLFA